MFKNSLYSVSWLYPRKTSRNDKGFQFPVIDGLWRFFTELFSFAE